MRVSNITSLSYMLAQNNIDLICIILDNIIKLGNNHTSTSLTAKDRYLITWATHAVLGRWV